MKMFCITETRAVENRFHSDSCLLTSFFILSVFIIVW